MGPETILLAIQGARAAMQLAIEAWHALEQRDEFIERHIGPSLNDIPAMLEAIGAPTLDALIERHGSWLPEYR